MTKLIPALLFAILMAPSTLWGHYVHISLYLPSEGYLSNSDKITPRGFCPITRVTDDYRLYYFQVHEDTGTLILFAPDNNWEAVARQLKNQTAFEKHRDRYVLAKFVGLPENNEKRSKFIANSFVSFFDKLAELHPDSEFGLDFRGHGGGGGELMGSRILPNDAFYMLKEWNRSLGRKLLCINMGWPCKKAAFSCLVNFCPFTKYYLGTDLNNGGYNMDDWTYEKYLECNPPIWEQWAEDMPYLDRVRNALEAKRRSYEYSRNNMIDNKIMQSQTCFDAEKFLAFSDAFQRVWETDKKRGSVDVKEYLETRSEEFLAFADSFQRTWEAQNKPGSTDVPAYLARRAKENAGLLEQFEDCMVVAVNNKDFFEWPREANGLYKFNSKAPTHLVSVGSPEGGTIEMFPKATVFRAGSRIDLVAKPHDGYVFDGWTGDILGPWPNITYGVDSDTLISASFSRIDESAKETTDSSNKPAVEQSVAQPTDDDRKKLEEVGARVVELDRELVTKNAAISSGDAKIALLEQELAAKKQQLNGNTGIIADLRAQVDPLNRENTRLLEWGQSLQKQNAELLEELTEVERLALVPHTQDWYYASGRGWLWTSPESYPWVYSDESKTWLFYELGTSNPWLYYDFTTQKWQEWN